MRRYKVLGLFFALCNLAFSEETVLIPISNGGYKRVPISEVIPKEEQIKIKEIEKEKQKKIARVLKTTREVSPISENTIFDDILTLSINYDDKNIDKNSLDNNKNPIENKIITDFINNSRTRERVTEDMYLFNLNFFGTKTEFEDKAEEKEDLKNKGIAAAIQYGITNDINIKFNAGYSKSEFIEDKSDNLYLSIDYSYSPYFNNDNSFSWELGTILGYFNGKSNYYRTEDMFIGLLYTNMFVPMTETIYFDGNFETTILSNKLGIGIRKEIYYFDNVDINLGISSDYVFGYKDRDKKIYTHLDEDKPTIKLNMGISGIDEYGLKVNGFYDFQYETYGLKMEYKF